MVKRILITLTGIFVCGCNMTLADLVLRENIPPDQLATLEPKFFGISASRYDTSSFLGWKDLSFIGYGYGTARIPAGTHILSVRVRNMEWKSVELMYVKFTAVAGRHYLIGHSFSNSQSRRWYPWIKDALTEEIVSEGVKPPRNSEDS